VKWLMVGMSEGGGCCRAGNEPSGYVKTCGIYRLADDLLASQAVLFHGVVWCRNVGTVCYVIVQAIGCQRPEYGAQVATVSKVSWSSQSDVASLS
jgi:hypothetical protein